MNDDDQLDPVAPEEALDEDGEEELGEDGMPKKVLPDDEEDEEDEY